MKGFIEVLTIGKGGEYVSTLVNVNYIISVIPSNAICDIYLVDNGVIHVHQEYDRVKEFIEAAQQ